MTRTSLMGVMAKKTYFYELISPLSKHAKEKGFSDLTRSEVTSLRNSVITAPQSRDTVPAPEHPQHLFFDFY